MPDIEALYKRAEEAFQKHNYDYARDLFQQILLLDPDHEKSHKALKATLLHKFQELGATGKLKLIALRGQFEIQLKATKDPHKKIELCLKFLNDDPRNSKIRTMLADTLLNQGKHTGAAAEAELAMADDPTNVPAAKILVASLKETGKVKEAQAILDRISSIAKEDRDLEKLQRDLAAVQTMKAGFEGGATYRDVMKDKETAAKLEAQHHLIQTEEQLVAVIKDLEHELNQNPTDARIPKKIGDLVFEKRKDYKSAQDWYRKASQLAPQDSVLRDKVDDCQLRIYEVQIDAAKKSGDARLKELQAADLKFKIQSYERRVADRPTDMGLRFELGKCYYQAGPSFTDKAIGEFQQAVRDPKKKGDSHLFLGMAFQRKKMYDMADKQYSLAEEGVLSQDRKLGILYNRAVCNAEAGKLPQAAELGKRIMEVDISYKDISQLVEKWSNGQK